MTTFTDGPALFGHGFGFAGAPFVGEHAVDLVSSDIGQGLPAMVANDRHQVVVVTREGAPGIVPSFRHWYGGPLEWAELVGARSRSQIVPRHATDENRNLVTGVIELPPVAVDKGAEVTIEAVLIEVDVRPWAVGTLDGGIRAATLLGFDAYVEGWRSSEVSEDTTGAQIRGVVRSDTESWTIAAGDVDSSYYPARFAVRLPCRIEDQVRSYRVGITNLRGCELVSAEAHGRVITSRIS